jgi:predicted CXXCH cytochrome family protein
MKISFHSIYILIFLFISCNTNPEQKKYQEILSTSLKNMDGYIGDKNCISCHKKESELWKGSHHDLAMQTANDSTVLGNFNNYKATIDGVGYLFYKEDNKFYVESDEIDGTQSKYQIAYTFGVTPLQQYLVDFDKGKKQVLRVTWDVINKRWYHQYPGDQIGTHDWLHWTNGAQNWNTMCAECHSTNLKKNYFIEKDSFHTTYSSINVSCESCHGPAERHVNWASKDPKGENSFILKGKIQTDQMNLCSSCHARRVKLTRDLEPGKNFEDQYMIQPLSTNFYQGDGQIEEEDYVFGSFLQSEMYKQGVKCTDCHDAHSLRLKFKENKLCTQCHEIIKYDSKEHHFHNENTEASQCINCHMPGKNYMGNDFRRDHSFRIPRPDQSVKYNTPNTCTECHKDKSDQWAANTIKKWYGPKRKDHFSDALLLSSKSDLTSNERKSLDVFINDLNYPSISRATVIDNLSYTDTDQYSALLLALKDSSAIVRYNSILKFRNLPLQDRISIALKHMNDSIKLVRIGAAQLIIGFDGTSISEGENISLQKANSELETMLYANADFSTGRMQLGDYYLQNRDLVTAIKNYEVALQKDSLLLPVYSNLATAYSMVGSNDKAINILEIWMKLEPTSGRPHYLRALLNFELGKNENAIEDLKKSIKLDPTDTRSLYNLATYYFQDKKDLLLAEGYINKALKMEPNNQEYKYLLALIYRDQGKFKSGQKIMEELRADQQKVSN